MAYSQRRLPHDYREGKWMFITWHLHGSLPFGHFPPPSKAATGRAFVWIDRHLDLSASGPLYLRQPLIAQVVVDALHKGVELGHFDLGAFVVMANHVHVLLLPKVNPSRLLQSLKGFTARQAKRILGRTGESFWQAESYDHWVRDEHEYLHIVRYIENNPVKAGLVDRPEDYHWSSARAAECLDKSVEAAEKSLCATKSRIP
jgi:putative transposase